METKERTALIFMALDELAIIEHLPTAKEKLSAFEAVRGILTPYQSTAKREAVHINTALKLITDPIGQTYYLNELSGFVSYQLEKALNHLL